MTEEIEKTNFTIDQMFRSLSKVVGERDKLQFEIDQLESDKEYLDRVGLDAKERLERLFRENEQLKAANDDMDVIILNYQLDTIPTLNKEIDRLKEELKLAKSQGWDDGYNEGITYGESGRNNQYN